MSTIDSRLRIEAALRGAKLAKSALSLVEDSVGLLTMKLVCRDLSLQVRELETFVQKCEGGRRE